MKTTTQILAAFSLMSAFTVHAAPPITITSLPFTVSSPGTYVLAQDLTFSGNGIAISIPTNLPGQVIVDLKGHTITGTGGGTGVGIGGDFTGPLVSNTSPITVRNGTLKGFPFGVWAESNFSAPLTLIEVSNMTLIWSGGAQNSVGVIFGGYIDNSTVRNCTFSAFVTGIEDVLSFGGNRYINCKFTNSNPLSIISGNGIVPVLEDCEFQAPAN